MVATVGVLKPFNTLKMGSKTHSRLLLLVALNLTLTFTLFALFIYQTTNYEEHEKDCEMAISETINRSLAFDCWDNPFRPETSSFQIGKPAENETRFVRNTMNPCPNLQADCEPLAEVKLTIEGNTLLCSIEGSHFVEFVKNTSYGVTFYYQDQYIGSYNSIKPDGNCGYGTNSDNDNFTPTILSQSLRSAQYPNMSLILARKESSKTLKGVYQCSVTLSSPEQRIDSNAIYYHGEEDSEYKFNYPQKTTKPINETFIGRYLNRSLTNLMDRQPQCKTFSSKADMITQNMTVDESRTRWKYFSKAYEGYDAVNPKIHYNLKYYPIARGEKIYQAECRIKELSGEKQEELLGLKLDKRYAEGKVHAERVCFGVNSKLVGCYFSPSILPVRAYRSSESYFNWTTNDIDTDEEIIVRKNNRIQVGDLQEQVFTILMANVQSYHRRFWCEKSFIFGKQPSEHSFESNYVSKPEAEMLPGPTAGMMFGYGQLFVLL